MDSRLSIRVPDELAQALADRKERCSMNVSAFVCRAIRNELTRPIFDAEPATTIEERLLEPATERRSASAPAVLISQSKASA
jgi:hypothetical protein